MKIEQGKGGIELIREPGDKALSHESAVVHHLRRLLNQEGKGWTRCWPDRMGLTSCRQGLQNRKLGIVYWHDRYAIEAAHKAFNSGRVFFSAAGGA
jgi:hypothetical protein